MEYIRNRPLNEAEIKSTFRNDFYCSNTKEYYESSSYVDLITAVNDFLNKNEKREEDVQIKNIT